MGFHGSVRRCPTPGYRRAHGSNLRVAIWALERSVLLDSLHRNPQASHPPAKGFVHARLLIWSAVRPATCGDGEQWQCVCGARVANAEELGTKVRLAASLNAILAERKLTQTEAAQVLRAVWFMEGASIFS